MGRRSKATRSRLQNLGEASKSQRTWPEVDIAGDASDVTSDEARDHRDSSGDVAIAAKFRYRSTPKTSDIDEMEKNVVQVACLEEIPQLQILRYVILFLAQKSATYTHYEDMQTVPQDLLLILTRRDFQVLRRRGQTRSTMGIALSLLIWHYH